ncbi:MAG: hypothetical protein KDI98_07070 [Hyphomicrobiaceae bacterium]|nr:hypothetical protein [Hyphomicrobiaceae bacterium]
MSLRPPKSSGPYNPFGANPFGTGPEGASPIEIEARAEQAASLGHAGRQVERTLAALDDTPGPKATRESLLFDAAEAVFAYFVQREALGMNDHRAIIKDYGIPPAVLRRVGARRSEDG